MILFIIQYLNVYLFEIYVYLYMHHIFEQTRSGSVGMCRKKMRINRSYGYRQERPKNIEHNKEYTIQNMNSMMGR